MLEVNSSSQQDNTESHDYINYVLCQLYAVFMSTFYNYYVRFGFFLTFTFH